MHQKDKIWNQRNKNIYQESTSNHHKTLIFLDPIFRFAVWKRKSIWLSFSKLSNPLAYIDFLNCCSFYSRSSMHCFKFASSGQNINLRWQNNIELSQFRRIVVIEEQVDIKNCHPPNHLCFLHLDIVSKT